MLNTCFGGEGVGAKHQLRALAIAPSDPLGCEIKLEDDAVGSVRIARLPQTHRMDSAVDAKGASDSDLEGPEVLLNRVLDFFAQGLTN